MIEISEGAAQLMVSAYAMGSGSITSIEMTCREDSVYMTVNRLYTGITEYKIIAEPEPKTNNVDIFEYTDCFTVTVNKEKFVFNGLSEPDSMMKIFKKLGIDFNYDEIARYHLEKDR